MASFAYSVPFMTSAPPTAPITYPDNDLTPGGAPQSLQEIPFHTILKGFTWGWGGGSWSLEINWREHLGNFVINDQATLTAVYYMVKDGCFDPCVAVPEVDFDSRTVLAAFTPWKCELTEGDLCIIEHVPGIMIDVVRVEQTGSMVTAHLKVTQLGDGCATIAILGSPFHVVDIPKTDAEIRFSVEAVVKGASCT